MKRLAVIDESARERLAIDVAGCIHSAWVIKVLSRLISERGTPHPIRQPDGAKETATPR